MRNRWLRFTVGLTLGLLIAVLASFNFLLLWVATGPRSLDVVTPYIEAAFTAEDKSYSVKVGETWLIWDGWKHPIDIRLKNVSVMTKQGQEFSTFPEISLGVDVLSILRGRVLPTSITITHPVISLFQNDDRSISFGFRKEQPTGAPAPETEENAAPLAAVLAPLVNPESAGSLSKLHYITILDADVSVGNKHKGIFFKASEADIMFKRDRHNTVQAVASAAISYDDYRSLLNADFVLREDRPTADGNITFTQLMPATLAGLFSDNKDFKSLQMPFSGKLNLSMDRAGIIQRIGFMLEGGKGKIKNERLEQEIAVDSLHLEGQVANQLHDVQVTRLNANLDGTLVTADGGVSMNNDDIAIRANATAKNIAAKDVHNFWPKGVSPQSREWITTNISEGTVREATAHVNIGFGDLAKPTLPRKAVDADVVLDGAKIRYLPEHPEVTNVKGVIHIDALSLTADIIGAEFLKNTKLSEGTLAIEDLNADNPYIKINFKAESTAKDIVKFLELPRLGHAQRLNLNADTAEGTTTGTASLGFSFFSPHDEKGNPIGEPDIAYDIAADLHAVTQPGFMKKFDIKGADGHLTVKNTGLEYAGKGEVNGASVSDANVKYLFKPEDGYDTFIDVKASVPVKSLPRFGYPAFSFLSGTLGVAAKDKLGTGLESAEANIDLTHAAVKMTGWGKPAEQPATLELSAIKKDGAVTIPSFALKSTDMDARGSAELNPDLSAFQLISLDKIKYDGTDLNKLVYGQKDGLLTVEVQGRSADLGPWVDAQEKSTEDSTFSFAHFPALAFKADVGHLNMGKNRELDKLKGEMSCDRNICQSANITGATTDGKPFALRILRNPKGKRALSLHAENAGAFLKAVNAFDSMENGDLSITGLYDDSSAGSVLKGRLDISEHTIRDAPVLAKILSLASLTGFFDTLQGKGINFVRLRAPFTLANDVITVKDGKTHGDAIGMTADGTITFPKREMDLQGLVVPSYTLNNVLGKVPIVGQVLTGGEGKGVFAAKYTVKGLSKDPNVSVNPLSILTPGFLRGLFDIFDKPKKDSDDDGE